MSDVIDPYRRRILTGAVAGAALAVAPISPVCASDFWAQPRRLRLVRPRTGESVDTIYWKDGQLNVEGYVKVCALMRDVSANKIVQMNPRLLDLLCAIQAWVGAYGYNRPIQVNSGYRAPETNSKLEGAARNSMHIHARAADIVIPGLPVSYIGQLAQHYSAGGVGFYYGSGFVHVDTGRIRTWKK